MNIRRTKSYELPQVVTFYYGLIDAMEDMENSPKWVKDVYPTVEDLREKIDAGEMFIGLEDEKIVAAMVLNQSSNDGYEGTSWNIDAADDEVMIIHLLAVDPGRIRQGIGSELVRYAIKHAENEGMKAIRLDVIHDNKNAEKLYQKHGFQYIETRKLYYEDTGWVDFLLYERLI